MYPEQLSEAATEMFCRSEACNFIKKENLEHVFSCEFCEISKNTFFTELLRVAASELYITETTSRSGIKNDTSSCRKKEFWIKLNKRFLII